MWVKLKKGKETFVTDQIWFHTQNQVFWHKGIHLCVENFFDQDQNMLPDIFLLRLPVKDGLDHYSL
jgi:hypothetical protein